MARFLLARLRHGLFVVGGITVVVFVVTRLVGDPVKVMLPLEATSEQRAVFRAQLGLDRPIPEQFATYVGDLFRFDLGQSLTQRRDVSEIVLEALPRTFEIVAAGMLLAVLIAVPFGVLAALRPGGIADRIIMVLSLAGLSVPQFWLGLMLILFFSVNLGWLPTSGTGSLRHLILPAVTLALPSAARILTMTRSSMIDELNSDYVKTTRAKGMPQRRTVGLHALKNSSIPVVTVTGWELIRGLAGYAVVVETVFAWPGIGLLALQAVRGQDLILLQGVVFTVAVLVVTVNVLLDVLYKVLDPRIKLTG